MSKDERIYTAEVIETDGYRQKRQSGSAIGCLRGVIVFLAVVALACGIGIAVGVKTSDTGNGILSGLGVFVVGTIIAVIMANTAKKITTVDCILPLVISIISGVVFMPFMLFQAELFSTLTCIGAGFFLTLGLFLYKNGKVGGASLIIPSIVFAYEILPISFPTDIDNIIAFSGDAMALCVSYFINKGKTLLTGGSGQDRF